MLGMHEHQAVKSGAALFAMGSLLNPTAALATELPTQNNEAQVMMIEMESVTSDIVISGLGGCAVTLEAGCYRVPQEITAEINVAAQVEIDRQAAAAAEQAAQEKAVADYLVRVAEEKANKAIADAQAKAQTSVKTPQSAASSQSIAEYKLEWLRAAGVIAESDFANVTYIFDHEAGANWNPAVESGNHCIGLGQNCPEVDKNGRVIRDENGDMIYWLDDSCPDWQTNAVCQIIRFNEYAIGRYGSWAKAAAFKRTNGTW